MTFTKDIEEAAHDIRRSLKPQVRRTARRLDALNDDVTGYVRKNPVKCLLGALAVGILIGKLANR